MRHPAELSFKPVLIDDLGGVAGSRRTSLAF